MSYVINCFQTMTKLDKLEYKVGFSLIVIFALCELFFK